jgi:hypothetical protein
VYVCGKKSIRSCLCCCEVFVYIWSAWVLLANPWPYAVFAGSAIRAKQAYLLDWRAGMERVGLGRGGEIVPV